MSAGTTKFFQYFQITHQIISVKWNKNIFKHNVVLTSL